MSTTDRYCAQCGGQQSNEPARPTATVPVSSPRRATTLSVFYPSSIVGWLIYLSLMASVGMAGVDMCEVPEERPLWFLGGCLAAYPFLIFWRWQFLERLAPQAAAAGKSRQESGGVNWNLVLWIIAMILVAIARNR